MYAIYTLKDGKKIQAYLWSDVIQWGLSHHFMYHNNISIYEIDNNQIINEIISDVYQENNCLFFNYENYKISVMDFDSLSVDELIEKINNNDSSITDSVIYWTLIKDTENVAIIDKRQVPDSIIAGLLRSYSGENPRYEEVLCLPTAKHHQKSDWSYKIELMPISKEDKIIYGPNTMYFQAFCSFVKNGFIKIVNKNKINQKVKMMKKEI